jgi:cephalosporin hydroxylase
MDFLKPKVSLLRMALITAVVGLAVYVHGRLDSTVARRFSQLAYYSSEQTWSVNKWLGIPAWQNPNDAWIIQEIITETRPDYIVEAGTLMGGSALLWATVLDQVNPDGKVITIDIKNKSEIARKYKLSQKIEYIIGSSTSPEVVSKIAAKVQGKKVLVILDSNHTTAHVLKELQSYSPLIQKGDYIVVQDSNIGGNPVYVEGNDPGPMGAIKQFLLSNSSFQSDSSRERLIYTTNPRGYLKRIN